MTASARIISIGGELILGRTIDTNAGWLAARLAESGVAAEQHLTVGDDLAAIRGAFAWAAAGADIVIATGGLGPTADDLTRQALAETMGVPLELHEELLPHIESFFRARRRPMPESNRVQAMVPRGAATLHNPIGTAPGLYAKLDRAVLPPAAVRSLNTSAIRNPQSAIAHVFCLPGVPAEMRRMFDEHIQPFLASMSRGRAIVEIVVQTYGGAEAEIGERLADLMQRGRNPDVGTTAKDAVIGVRINAAGPTRAEARTLAERDAAEVERRLAEWAFGREPVTLQAAVAQLLFAGGWTIATAESCTGGLLAKRLTDIPGSSRFFLEGFVTYSNEAKVARLGVPPDLIAAHGAVSEPVARAMASGACDRTGSNLAVSITGIAGPEGGTPDKPVGLVYVGLAWRRAPVSSDETGQAAAPGCIVRELRFGAHLTRHEIRDRTVKAALNLLRLHLTHAPQIAQNQRA